MLYKNTLNLAYIQAAPPYLYVNFKLVKEGKILCKNGLREFVSNQSKCPGLCFWTQMAWCVCLALTVEYVTCIDEGTDAEIIVLKWYTCLLQNAEYFGHLLCKPCYLRPLSRRAVLNHTGEALILGADQQSTQHCVWGQLTRPVMWAMRELWMHKYFPRCVIIGSPLLICLF